MNALSTKEGTRIAIALSHIQSAKIRRRIAELLEAIIKEERDQARLHGSGYGGGGNSEAASVGRPRSTPRGLQRC